MGQIAYFSDKSNNKEITYLRVTCTNCGCTDKARNWFNQAEQHRLIKGCYNCDPVKQTKEERKKYNER